MKKIEYKKDYKQLYLPKITPSIIDVPKISYITINGEGNPNSEVFAKNIEVLYALSYAVKMSYKRTDVSEDYYEYTVFPLEGVWDLIDVTKPATDKDNLKYKLMIRQPDFLTTELYARFVSQVKNKKPQLEVEKVEFETITEGLCCQMMHIGSYDDEPVSFERMMKFCNDNGYKRILRIHREIYISDPRKVEPSKRKTVLRFNIQKH